MQSLLLRMHELTIQALSDTNSAANRSALDSELSQLELEISHSGSATFFGGVPLFDGNTRFVQLGPDPVTRWKFIPIL